MKYIRLDYAGFVIFEESQKHSDIAKLYPNDTVLSAGFVRGVLEDGQIDCSGESTSLNKKADEEDSDDLKRKISSY